MTWAARSTPTVSAGIIHAGKEEIIKYLVEPLASRGLVMVQNLTPAMPIPSAAWSRSLDRAEVYRPVRQRAGLPSTKQGLDEGVRRGVMEIHAHRAWTHMNWDLDSPPGPWWDAPIGGERAHRDWYNETFDTRRNVRSRPTTCSSSTRPAATRSNAIRVDATGGNSSRGTGPGHDNGRLAVIAGYGVDRWHYLGRDHAIQLSIRQMTPKNSPVTIWTSSRERY